VQSISKIILSRTTDLSNPNNVYEGKAKVNVQSENGAVYPLTEGTTGTYTSAALTLPTNIRYRVQIITQGGTEYLSDYVTGQTTPPIDNVTWEKTAEGGIQLYANSTIQQGQTMYYQWKTDETWEFHSSAYTRYKWVYNNLGETIGITLWAANGSLDTTIYTCWRSESSSLLQLRNLDQFSSTKIHQPIAYISPNSVKLSVRYSLNIQQYSISKEAYLFLETMKKNTEQLGTVFDPQPSYLPGNVRSVSNSKEQVIGYVSATQETTKRIFLTPSDVGGWPYQAKCEPRNAGSDPRELRGWFRYYPLDRVPGSDSIVMLPDSCLNCLTKGVNKKPSFW
jgi:hypothetical protein